VGVEHENTVPTSTDLTASEHTTTYDAKVQLRYNFRLDPTPGQRTALAKTFGCARWVYNEALRQRKDAHERGEGWIAGGKLALPRIGDVAVRWSRGLPSQPSSVTIVKDGSGRYFASFVVVTDEAEDLARFPHAQTDVGIDLGLASFAVLSDGAVIDNPRFLRRAERRLRKAQQNLSRTQKGSNNRRKAVLAVGGLGRSRLAKSVHDAGWSAFTGMLAYKAARYGRAFGRVDRWAPTSQECSACGVKDGPKPLEVRRWRCGGCAAVHERDLNAARNILTLGRQLVAAGRTETLNACGAQVRPGAVPAQRGEAGTRRSDRVSVTHAAQ
jgi:putative transposase